MSTNKVWNLMYQLGNTDRVIGDADNPQPRNKALDGADVIAQLGWRVWVEHHKNGRQIYQSGAVAEKVSDGQAASRD